MSKPGYIGIGIDFGTSGCRGIAIDTSGRTIAEAEVALPPSRQEGLKVEQDAHAWWLALEGLMPTLLARLDRRCVRAICVDGTSGTTLLANAEGQPITPALIYNDNRASTEAEQIAAVAPRDCAAHGTGSGLAKAMWLLNSHCTAPARIHTQADWLAGMLCGDFSTSDPNNALKLGYDPIA